jgi:hypothetical protein
LKKSDLQQLSLQVRRLSKTLSLSMNDPFIFFCSFYNSLILERFFRENVSLITPVIAMLMLGPILLDTINLNPQRHRVTPKDEVVAQKLLTIAQINQNTFFEELQTAKFNDQSLTTWGTFTCHSHTHRILSFPFLLQHFIDSSSRFHFVSLCLYQFFKFY